MHKKLILLFGVAVYYSVSFYGLYILDVGILMTSIIFFGVPAYILARFSAAPTNVLLSVVLFGTGLSLLLEGIAHIYGLWTVVGIESFRIFNLIPVEAFFATILQILFLVLLYELLFDDGQYSTTHVHTRILSLGVFSIGALTLVSLYYNLFNEQFIANAYMWMAGIMLVASIAALAVYKALTVALFDRITHFAIAAAIPLYGAAILSVTNGQKIFEGETYVELVSLGNVSLPIESILFMFALPFFVATIYELYMDDRI